MKKVMIYCSYAKQLILRLFFKSIVIVINFRHSDEMIDRLERAGLGYHVNSDETDDKLGKLIH